MEHRAKHDYVYLLSAVPLTNSTPNFSHFGDTISTGVTAAIGIAFLPTMLHATSLILLDNNHARACTVNTVLTVVQRCIDPQYRKLVGLLLECLKLQKTE